MRFGTTVAVTVLATGVIFGRPAADVNPPPAGQSKIEGSVDKPGQKHQASMSVIPWKQHDVQPEHALLKGLVGHWTTNVHVAEGPYAKAKDTVGTADGKVLMGGLFVQVVQSETRMKQAFERMTTYGFNEALGKYTAEVIDSAGTESLHYTGTYDAAKKQLIMSTHYTEGKTRKLTIRRTVMASIDDKTWRYEEFVSHAVGEAETPVVAVVFKKG